MPGYDGTGPKSLGPMTGGGRGYCIIKLSSASDGPPVGFAGQSGYPTQLTSCSSDTALDSLHNRLWQIKTAIRSIRGRITVLEATIDKK
jgi:hypothetical protein